MQTSNRSLLSLVTPLSLAVLPLLLGVACGGIRDPADSEETALDPGSISQPLSLVVGQNLRVSSDSTMAAQNQPAAATALSHPGHLLIAAHSYPPEATSPVNGEAAYWLSHNGGQTFPTQGIVPGLTVAYGGVYKGASDLSLACGPTEHCYFAAFVYDLALARTGIAVSHSGDEGATWDAPTIVISEDDPGLFNQRCSIAVDTSSGPNQGSVYVSWIRVEIGKKGVESVPIWFAASSDQGQTFTAPKAISDLEAHLFNNKPQTVVDGVGRVFVVYKNTLLDDPVRNQHVVQRSDDGGATFTAATHVTYVYDAVPLPPASFRQNSFPQMAVEPLTGALLVAWTDKRSGSPDILLTRSTDAGGSWSEPVRGNDTPTGQPIQHALPALACGPLGVCGVSFYSSRNDPNGLLLDTYFAPVELGAPGANVLVSSVPMNPNVQFNGKFIGDYNALVMRQGAANAVWTDTRVGQPDPQQDIFTARINVQP